MYEHSGFLKQIQVDRRFTSSHVYSESVPLLLTRVKIDAGSYSFFKSVTCFLWFYLEVDGCFCRLFHIFFGTMCNGSYAPGL